MGYVEFEGGPPRPKFMLEGETIEAARGNLVWIERGKVHGFMNPFDEATVMLCTITPGVLGPEYFREIHTLLAVGGPSGPKAMGGNNVEAVKASAA